MNKKIPADLRTRINKLAHLEGQVYGTRRRAEMLAELAERLESGWKRDDLIGLLSRWEQQAPPM
tara:strand:- start:39094 stop:39285 length:192 start_codon:yes stop_codon:yes gene_type:complete